MSICKVDLNKQDTRNTVREQMEQINDNIVVIEHIKKQRKARNTTKNGQ